MVLRWMLALCLLQVVILTPFAHALDSQAFEKAQALFQNGKNEQAMRMLESSYNLSNRELPLKVASLAASIAIAMKKWKKAEHVVDSALQNKWPGWPPADIVSKKNVKKLRSQPDVLALIKLGAQAKSEIFAAGGDDLTGDARTKLRSEIKTYADALSATGYNTEAAQADWSKVQGQPDPVPHPDYKFSLMLLASYWTWEDRPSFSYQLAGRAVLYNPCFGLGLKYSNGRYTWDGGVCGGVGTGDLQFNDGHFSHASPTLVAGFGSFSVRLSDAGAAFGVEGDLMNITISGTDTGGAGVSATNQDFAFMAVGRYAIGGLEMKFKGGTIVQSPSALWIFELSYPIY